MSKMQVSAADVSALLKRFAGGMSFVGGELEYHGAGLRITASTLQLQAVIRIEVGGLRLNAHALTLDPNGAEVDFDLG